MAGVYMFGQPLSFYGHGPDFCACIDRAVVDIFARTNEKLGMRKQTRLGQSATCCFSVARNAELLRGSLFGALSLGLGCRLTPQPRSSPFPFFLASPQTPPCSTKHSQGCQRPPGPPSKTWPRSVHPAALPASAGPYSS